MVLYELYSSNYVQTLKLSNMFSNNVRSVNIVFLYKYYNPQVKYEELLPFHIIAFHKNPWFRLILFL